LRSGGAGQVRVMRPVVPAPNVSFAGTGGSKRYMNSRLSLHKNFVNKAKEKIGRPSNHTLG
jgi:hypothetical protein